MTEDAYGTRQQIICSVVESQKQPVQPLLHKQKWVVSESPAAAKGWKGRTEG